MGLLNSHRLLESRLLYQKMFPVVLCILAGVTKLLPMSGFTGTISYSIVKQQLASLVSHLLMISHLVIQLVSSLIIQDVYIFSSMEHLQGQLLLDYP